MSTDPKPKKSRWTAWILFLATMVLVLALGLLASSIMERRSEAEFAFTPQVQYMDLEQGGQRGSVEEFLLRCVLGAREETGLPSGYECTPLLEAIRMVASEDEVDDKVGELAEPLLLRNRAAQIRKRLARMVRLNREVNS